MDERTNTKQITMAQQKCCTPEGQIKRYVDCIGCDRKPDDGITMAQTAVDWIVDKLLSDRDKLLWHEIIEQAKKMEKVQIEKAYSEGVFSELQWRSAEQYYIEVYTQSGTE